MNRTHTSSQIESSIKLLQDLGLENINLDLMYGLPDLKYDSWKKDLKKSIDLGVLICLVIA